MLAPLLADSVSDTRPLFSYVDKSVDIANLDYILFLKKLKQVLAKAGVHLDGYNGHSFRHGGCSFAFQVGIPPLLIKLCGDWR